MKTYCIGFISFLVTTFATVSAPVQWAGNGHYYEAINTGGNNIDWATANNDAIAKGGYLATITTSLENQFISLTFPEAGTFQHEYWIGGFQPPGSPEPAGNWQWVTGEAFSYNNWAAGHPDNAGNGGEDRIHLFAPGSGLGDIKWDDANSSVLMHGYVVEMVPEPSTYVLWSTCAAGVLVVRARARFWGRT